MVPRTVLHRTRAPKRAVILMVENAGIIPTGTERLLPWPKSCLVQAMDWGRLATAGLSFGMRVRRSILPAQQCVRLGISGHELLLWIPRQASAQLHRVVRQNARRG